MTFIKFLGVGGFATLVQYLLLVVLVETGLLSAAPASAIGYICASLVNYLLNYYLTFGSNARHQVAGVKFALVAVTGLGLNTALVYLLAHLLGVYYLFSQVLATLAVLFWNFFAHKHWTYKVA